jgi:hypothetical protein
LRRPAAALPLAAARRPAHVAVRAVSLKCHAAAALMTGAEPVGATARLTDREVRRGTRRRRLALGTRQRGANQRPMHRPFLDIVDIVATGIAAFLIVTVWQQRSAELGRGPLGGRGFGFRRRLARVSLARLFHGGLDDGRLLGRRALRSSGRRLGMKSARRFRFAPLPRLSRLLVLVFGVARRAARLLHFGSDHRDNRVIGDAPFPRTVIVQNVTKPKLALLHSKLPKDPRWRGKKCERRGQY